MSLELASGLGGTLDHHTPNTNKALVHYYYDVLFFEGFFPFGSASGDAFLPFRNDIASSELLTPIPCPYFGTNETSLFVSYC